MAWVCSIDWTATAAWVQALGSILAIGTGFAVITFGQRQQQKGLREVGMALCDNVVGTLAQTAAAMRQAEDHRELHPISFARPQVTIALIIIDDVLKSYPAHETGHPPFARTIVTLRILIARAVAEVEVSNATRHLGRSTEPQIETISRLLKDALDTHRELQNWV